MMHIEYDEKKMAFYETYIKNTFMENVKSLRHNYVFRYKKEDYQIDSDCEAFLDYLIKDDNLWKLANTPAADLEKTISEYHSLFNGLSFKGRGKNTLLYKCAYHIFVDIGYENLDKAKMIEAIGVDVCPYCNRVFIRSVKTSKDYADIKKGKKFVRGELDHFHTKERYPFLGVSRYNLVPSCSFCNGPSGKHLDDAIEKKLYNPYLIKTDLSEVHFDVDFKDGGSLKFKDCENSVSIDLTCEPYLEGNMEEFNIKALYETHKDYAVELYQIAQMRTKHKYYRFLKRSMERHGEKISKEDVARLLIRNYTNPVDFNKRPLSKFMNDIAKDLDILQ